MTELFFGVEAPVYRITTLSRSVVLRIPASLEELLLGCPTGLVYSNEEQRHCLRRRDLTGWAGRLAAKLAVAELIGFSGTDALAAHADAGLAQIVILPQRQRQGLCADGPGCLKPHAPQVDLIDFHGGHFQISISHTRSRAVALAVRTLERSVLTP